MEKDATARLRRAVKENNLFLVKRLIKRTDLRNPDPGPTRYTSLAWAAVSGHEETFEFLLNAGHDDQELSKDSENNTILILLAEIKPPPIGANNGGNDILGAALRMARLYFERYPYILDWSNSEGRTALHVAAMTGKDDMVRMLCDYGADVDLTDNEGNTPLHYASAWNNIPIVQLLIERGCQYNAQNNEGFTPSDYAYSFSTRETLQDTARNQFEYNKKARRIFAQAAARGSEWVGPDSKIDKKLPPRPVDVQAGVRLRSGSAASRNTATSDSDYEGPPSGFSNGSQSSKPHSATSFYQNSSGTFSSPSHFRNGSILHPPLTNPASALTPIANRTLQKDADAMEKYMKRNRSGSASTDIKSQTSNPSSAGPSANGDDIANLPLSGSVAPRRRIRPSASAAQLRTPKPPPGSAAIAEGVRSRAGTNPSTIRANPPTFSPPSGALPLPPPGSRAPSRNKMTANGPLTEEPQTFTGPPSKYATFPEPPPPVETLITSGAPAGGNAQLSASTTPTASRRLPFHHILGKPAQTASVDHSAGHRRGSSSHSLR
ncbi:unnamed protein product [Peniophora sp. CBMAI 1063]|nr:unnamed protein product [Peniophora sp. CBMAI 1063]